MHVPLDAIMAICDALIDDALRNVALIVMIETRNPCAFIAGLLHAVHLRGHVEDRYTDHSVLFAGTLFVFEKPDGRKRKTS